MKVRSAFSILIHVYLFIYLIIYLFIIYTSDIHKLKVAINVEVIMTQKEDTMEW